MVFWDARLKTRRAAAARFLADWFSKPIVGTNDSHELAVELRPSRLSQGLEAL
jgi:hypothetical protein